MSKRIALFFDGTWNNPDDNTNITKTTKLVSGAVSMEGAPLANDLENGDTNVFRLFLRMIARRGFRMLGGDLVQEGPTEGRESEQEQVKYYHRGVGERLGEWIRGGVGGYGLSRNIQEAYLWLAQHYETGDKIFLFGFSRGAFTARSFAGLINRCGIPINQDERALLIQIKDAYEVYRQSPPDTLLTEQYKKTYEDYIHPDSGIEFIGVWDTVGALGIDTRIRWVGRHNFAWHDVELSPTVKNAYHAMALDEHRPDFDVEKWKANWPKQNAEQRWFIGAHGNVGGGYGPKDRLPDISLDWMQGKAEHIGLEFKDRANVHAQAYLDPIRDSYEEFLPNLLSSNYQKRHPPINRTRGGGICERFDDTIQNRVKAGGKDEKGKPYRG
jgi:uncharacterized protein (DUF2235 family)